LTVPVWIIFMFIGTVLFVYYHNHPGELSGQIRPDGVFPHFIMSKFPPGIVGLVIAALLASAISSTVAALNSLVAVGLEDYYKRWRPHRADKHYFRTSKLLVVLCGLLAMLMSSLYLLAGDEGVLGIVFVLYAIFSGGIAGIFLLGFFVPWANKEGLNVAISVCVLFTGYAVLTSTTIGSGSGERVIVDMGDLNFTHHKLMLGVYTHLIILGVGSVASYFFPKKEVDKNLVFAGWSNAKKQGRLKIK
ncbi:MAG TPA: sodium transporter, partial [Agriterribacter sp.]|nr:sodium transporter [Agriterribacter sp.]